MLAMSEFETETLSNIIDTVVCVNKVLNRVR